MRIHRRRFLAAASALAALPSAVIAQASLPRVAVVGLSGEGYDELEQFSFAKKGYLSVECPWRILQQGRTTLSSDDYGQQYGLPAPIDAAAEATKLLSAIDIDAAQLRVGANDILIDFSDDGRLEIIPISSGYEGWQMMNPFGTEFFARGGGQISLGKAEANA